MNIVAGVLYISTYCLACISIILYPKSDSKHSVVGWAAISFFLLMSIDGIVAGILTLLHIPSNLVSATIVHAAVIAFAAFVISKRKSRQPLHLDLLECGIALAFLVVTALCARAEFGPNLTLHYITSDPANHLRSSIAIFENSAVSSMYMAWNFVAQIIAVISPFVPTTLFYKALIISDILFLLFGGLLPYALASAMLPKASKAHRAIFAFGSLLYLLGYPLNGMIYGFCYLGVGVAMTTCAAFFSFSYWNDQSRFNALGLALSLSGLILSYSLFAPIVYFSCFIVFMLSSLRNGRPTKRTAVLVFLIFIVPGIFGFFYSYGGFFAGTHTISGSIMAEGGIYRNLYSSLLPLLPFAITGAISAFTKKVKGANVVPFVIIMLSIIGFMLLCFILSVQRLMSTYYYFKFYYLLSPFVFTAAILGINYALVEKTRTLAISLASVLAFCGFMETFRIDERLPRFSGMFDYGLPQSYHPEFDLYHFNIYNLRNAPEFSPDVMDLYTEAYALTEKTDRLVPVLSSYSYQYWYTAIVRQEPTYTSDYIPTANEPSELASTISESCDYVVVVSLDFANTDPITNPGSAQSQEAAAMLGNDLEIIYSNSAGYIAKVLG